MPKETNQDKTKWKRNIEANKPKRRSARKEAVAKNESDREQAKTLRIKGNYDRTECRRIAERTW